MREKNPGEEQHRRRGMMKIKLETRRQEGAKGERREKSRGGEGKGEKRKPKSHEGEDSHRR